MVLGVRLRGFFYGKMGRQKDVWDLLVRCLHLFCLCLSVLFCDSWSDRLFAYDWVSMLKKWKSVFKIAKLIRDSRESQGCGDSSDVCFCLRDVAMPNLRKWDDDFWWMKFRKNPIMAVWIPHCRLNLQFFFISIAKKMGDISPAFSALTCLLCTVYVGFSFGASFYIFLYVSYVWRENLEVLPRFDELVPCFSHGDWWTPGKTCALWQLKTRLQDVACEHFQRGRFIATLQLVILGSDPKGSRVAIWSLQL